jgi:hypothetical protein
MASIEEKEAPITAFEMACRVAQVVKTLVGRPMHVAIVNGLNRKLRTVSKASFHQQRAVLTQLQWTSYSTSCPSVVMCKVAMIQPAPIPQSS